MAGSEVHFVGMRVSVILPPLSDMHMDTQIKTGHTGWAVTRISKGLPGVCLWGGGEV